MSSRLSSPCVLSSLTHILACGCMLAFGIVSSSAAQVRVEFTPELGVFVATEPVANRPSLGEAICPANPSGIDNGFSTCTPGWVGGAAKQRAAAVIGGRLEARLNANVGLEMTASWSPSAVGNDLREQPAHIFAAGVQLLIRPQVRRSLIVPYVGVGIARVVHAGLGFDSLSQFGPGNVAGYWGPGTVGAWAPTLAVGTEIRMGSSTAVRADVQFMPYSLESDPRWYPSGRQNDFVISFGLVTDLFGFRHGKAVGR